MPGMDGMMPGMDGMEGCKEGERMCFPSAFDESGMFLEVACLSALAPSSGLSFTSGKG